MVKHSQTIRRQIADELFECVWPFCGIGAERVNYTPTHLYSIDFSTSRFVVVGHRNIRLKHKLRKSVTSSSFVNSANSHDIANKRIVGRYRINVLTEPGNYYISSCVFEDKGIPHKPPTVFQTNYFHTNFSDVFNHSYSFKP